MAIEDVIAVGEEIGIFEFYLPFVIMFAILYGLLSKSKIFGDQDKDRKVRAINLVISLAAAAFVMAYPNPVGITLTTFFATLFTNALIVIVTMLIFLMLTALVLGLSGEEMKLGKGLKFVVLLIIILVIGIFISSGGLAFFPGITLGTVEEPAVIFPNLNLTTEHIAIIVLVVLTGLVIWFVYRSGGGEKGKPGRGLEIRRL